MTSAILDLSGGEKPAQIQENLIAYMRLFAGLPGMAMQDGDSFWFISNKPAPGNTILRTRWPVEGVEERIDALLGQIGQYIDEIGWMVYPGDQPTGLGRRLVARGMPEGRAGNWLYGELAAMDLDFKSNVPGGFHIEQVRSDERLAEWVRVSEAGFGGELSCFYDAYARHGYGPEAFSLHYTGYLGDTPVTSGTLLDAGGTASIYDVSTPPGFRRRGFGAAIMRFMLREIHRRGYQDTWIWSSDIARSLYQQLGYADADFGIREYGWMKHQPEPKQPPEQGG